MLDETQKNFVVAVVVEGFLSATPSFFKKLHTSVEGRLWFEDTGRAGQYTWVKGSSKALARSCPGFGNTLAAALGL